MSHDEFYHLLSSQESIDGFTQVLRQLNGFFAVVHRIGQRLLIAEDRTRSFPLFYGSSREGFYVSDDPRWVRDQVGDYDLDRVSASEFLLTGYVTGKDTLYPHVKQVQAGEVLVIQPANSSLQTQDIQYYQYRHGNYLEKSTKELHMLLDEILLRIFQRVTWFADGRTIVVPLSGGYDSRLVVLMLKRLGYQNVAAFSYGRPGNAESQVSKEVAKALGIRWELVPYTNEAWSIWYHTKEYRQYARMADGLVSVPNIQDWPAVWELTRHHIIPKDSIIMPGHVVLSGINRFPVLSSREIRMSEDKFVRLIYNTDYQLQEASQEIKQIMSRIYAKIKTEVGDRSSYSLESAADAYERWSWQERGTKHTINSVRVYEYWGYEWWLPLEDSELIDFWGRVPLAHRLHKSLHKSYVRKLERRIIGRNIREYKPLWLMAPISFGVRILPKTPFFKYVRRMHMLREYDRHPLAFWGIVPKKSHRALCTGKGDINSFVALDTLRTLTSKSEPNRATVSRTTLPPDE
jgi:asparagine synthase (glutamine-hydrolysing)